MLRRSGVVVREKISVMLDGVVGTDRIILERVDFGVSCGRDRGAASVDDSTPSGLKRFAVIPTLNLFVKSSNAFVVNVELSRVGVVESFSLRPLCESFGRNCRAGRGIDAAGVQESRC